MSTAKRLLEKSKKKPGGRRYVDRSTGPTGITWADIDASSIVETICYAAGANGALRFGVTSDGGALALGVYGDGDKAYTLYSPTAEGMQDHLRGLADVFEAIATEELP